MKNVNYVTTEAWEQLRLSGETTRIDPFHIKTKTDTIFSHVCPRCNEPGFACTHPMPSHPFCKGCSCRKKAASQIPQP